ncbi:hypothetical protein O9X98_11005 [Agrobacterium salinitolerans]|nr:hypothetical protein [Agrobacterium salinitolerans]
MSKVSVSLGHSVPLHTVNRDKVAQKATALAETYLLPSGIEFASFEHDGRVFAISARLTVEVDLVPGRLPDHVIREGGLVVPKRKKLRFASKA